MNDKTVTKFKTNETETIFIYITTPIKTDPLKVVVFLFALFPIRLLGPT